MEIHAIHCAKFVGPLWIGQHFFYYGHRSMHVAVCVCVLAIVLAMSDDV